jgi:hypothetical protein
MRVIVRILIALSALLGSATVAAAPCAGFADLDSASPFCPNVEWIRNRAITLGCSANAYCPSDNVTRLAMAAFLNRLGTALTPIQLQTVATPGATDLEANVVVCQSGDFVVSGFPRHAVLDAVFAATSPADIDYAILPVMMTDNSALWTAVNNGYNASHLLPNRWNSVAAIGSIDLAVGTTVRFGIRAERVVGAGTADLSDSRCQLRVLIFSRDGTTSPF